MTVTVQLKGAASGLGYLHSHDIVHGDLKGVSDQICHKIGSDVITPRSTSLWIPGPLPA